MFLQSTGDIFEEKPECTIKMVSQHYQFSFVSFEKVFQLKKGTSQTFKTCTTFRSVHSTGLILCTLSDVFRRHGAIQAFVFGEKHVEI